MPSYRVLTVQATKKLAKQFVEEGLHDRELVENYATNAGEGNEIDLSPFDKAVKLMDEIRIDFDSRAAPTREIDHAEGKMARALATQISESSTPISVLSDPSFWRYLTLSRFWDCAKWRQTDTFKPSGAYLTQVLCTTNNKAFLVRCYLRGRIALEGGDGKLAHKIKKDTTDLWQSHILGVATGFSPLIAAEVIRCQQEMKLPVTEDKKPGPMRNAAIDLNRTNSNIITLQFEAADAKDHVFRRWDAHRQEKGSS